jgi:branched-chain amino acid transport system permease protein
MKKILRVMVISLWFGFLTFPFMGKHAGLLIVLLLAGGGLWLVITTLRNTKTVKQWLERASSYQQGFQRNLNRRDRRIVLGILLVLALLFPLFNNRYVVDVAVMCGIYICLALGLNIVVGLAGLLDLGYVAFYAVGAYLYGLLSIHYGTSFWLALPLGALMAATFGVLLGAPTLRLRGDYLAIVTLGFGEMIRIILNNWDRVTRGPNGLIGIEAPSLGKKFVFSQPIHYYYLILLIVILTVFVVNRLNHSRIGRAWIAIREDEVAAEAMGIDTTRMKLLAFALGAMWAGLGGVFFASKMSFISPESFTFFESVIILCMVVLGGMGSIPGVILGAIVLVVLPEMLRDFYLPFMQVDFSRARMLIFGMLMVLVMIFRPQGLIPSARRKLELHPEKEENIIEQKPEFVYEVASKSQEL